MRGIIIDTTHHTTVEKQRYQGQLGEEIARHYAALWRWTAWVRPLDPVCCDHWHGLLVSNGCGANQNARLSDHLLLLGEYAVARALAQTPLAGHSCWGCRRREERLKSSVCGRCRCAFYCSKECQQRDWPFHKRACTTTAAQDATADPKALPPLDSAALERLSRRSVR